MNRADHRRQAAARCLFWVTLAGCGLIEEASRAADAAFTLGGASISLTEETPNVDVYYRWMRFNHASDSWNVEVVVTNKSSRSLSGPFVLLVDGFAGTTGPADADGLDSSVPPKSYYDWGGSVPGGTLGPGQSSVSRTITLGFNKGSPGLATRFFAKSTPRGIALALTRSLNDAGQPLGGVQVQEMGPGGVSTNFTEDAAGMVTLGSVSGNYTWKFSTPGYLPVWRQLTLATGAVATVPYPRLVARDTNLFLLSPIAGGIVTNGSATVQITFPPGVARHPKPVVRN